MITSILAALAATLLAGAITYLIFLAFKTVTNNLRAKQEELKADEVGFIIKQSLDSGKVKIQSGFFNRETQETRKVDTYVADTVDHELRTMDDLMVFD